MICLSTAIGPVDKFTPTPEEAPSGGLIGYVCIGILGSIIVLAMLSDVKNIIDGVTSWGGGHVTPKATQRGYGIFKYKNMGNPKPSRLNTSRNAPNR